MKNDVRFDVYNFMRSFQNVFSLNIGQKKKIRRWKKMKNERKKQNVKKMKKCDKNRYE